MAGETTVSWGQKKAALDRVHQCAASILAFSFLLLPLGCSSSCYWPFLEKNVFAPGKQLFAPTVKRLICTAFTLLEISLDVLSESIFTMHLVGIWPMANLATSSNLLATVVGIVALGLAPLAFALWFFYTRDKLNPEPRRLILKVFGLGVLAFIPVFLVRQFVPLPVWLMVVVVVPVLAELAKFWVVKQGVYHHPEFDEPVDGIIFAAAAALGFAALEVVGSMLYAYFAVARLGVPGESINSAWSAVLNMFALRGLLAGPGHALWSSLWGYALGRAKFLPADRASGLVRNGLLAAMLSHSAFNALALESSWWLNRLGLVAVIAVLWFVVMRCLRYALALTPEPEVRSG